MPLAYDFASCITIDCPRCADPTLSPSITKSKMYRDVIGNYWCPLCTKRGELIDWADANGWPAARVQGHDVHALAGSPADWLTSIVMATEDMVDALYETLIEQKRAQLDLNDHSEGIGRVKAWLEAFEEAEETLLRRAEAMKAEQLLEETE